LTDVRDSFGFAVICLTVHMYVPVKLLQVPDDHISPKSFVKVCEVLAVFVVQDVIHMALAEETSSVTRKGAVFRHLMGHAHFEQQLVWYQQHLQVRAQSSQKPLLVT
jgi:hypothetical protein